MKLKFESNSGSNSLIAKPILRWWDGPWSTKFIVLLSVSFSGRKLTLFSSSTLMLRQFAYSYCFVYNSCKIVVSVAAKIISFRSRCSSTMLQKTFSKLGTVIARLPTLRSTAFYLICVLSRFVLVLAMPTIASCSAC
jgi:hypothetical protein